ncbi:protein HGV2-like isoform X4 [Actinia tenebrosa]|uniref:Protein HGV2-like isoform X4 n=1 Tax=Actinia tenebrosa TaxID=6105 RepID=A0A6P8HKC2_ACTTE|nr:protein HGV2-like isoform X4 [Actinia tenebrosa]
MAAVTENTAASSSTFDEDVKKLMGKGKVHLVCNETLEAVKCFEEATKKLDEKYGASADECGEAYFYYGKSLLEVARMEGGVIGNALQGAIDTVQENGDGEESTDKKDEKDKDDKNTDAEKKKDEGLIETNEAEKTMAKKDEKDEAKPKEQEVTSEDKKEEAQEAAADEDEDGDEGAEEEEPMEGGEEEGENVEAEQTEEEEPTNMELAWQMLEFARLIFQKKESKEGKLMLAQCHLKLGEIQMEQEQFLNAVEDFLKCLDLQKEHLEPDNRLLAETAYNIGLGFSFQSMHEKSKEYYNHALETIDLRIKNLQKNIEEAESKSKGKEKATEDNPLVANRKELQELQELYPEIKAKVDDASEMMKQESKKADVSSLMGNGASTTIGFGDSSNKAAPVSMIATKKAPVAATDISHLVHRNKRKPEEASDDDTAAKKPCQDTDTPKANDKPAETTNGNTETTMQVTPAES